MNKYVVIANRPNRIATIHLQTCSHKGNDALAQTNSSERRGFDDGLDALVFAQNAMPKNSGFCGHCLKERRGLAA